MNFKIIIPLLLWSVITTAQSKEIPVQTKISDVTVFTTGAQVSRSADVNIPKGISTLAFQKLSPFMDEKSLQFNAGGDITVLSINYEIRYDESAKARKDSVVQLNNSLKDLKDEITSYQNQLAVSVNEEQVLLNNTDFDSWDGMTITQLEQGVNLVRSRLTEIKERKEQFRNRIDELNEQRQRIINELQKKRIKDATPQGVVLVKLSAESSQKLETEISYVVADAGWSPYYDLRVENVSSPLKIEYKAKVYQNTGEDWKGVNLVLSTGNPYEEANLPELYPWYLNYGYNPSIYKTKPIAPQKNGVTGTINGVVVDAKTQETMPYANVVVLDQNRNILQGTTSDIDGNFSIKLSSPASYLEVSFVGYNKYSQHISQADQFYTIKLHEAEEMLEEVMVIYDQPLINKTKSTRTYSQSSIENADAEINVRGARSDGTIYIVDGVKMRNGSIITGGLPAQYGNAISRNPVNLKFEIDLPYDIPSDGQEYKVAVTEYTREVDYLYKAVPKLNEHAFLTAGLLNWEELNLMNGNAGVYYEGTYLGETFLDVEKAGDTLEVSLGKDENIKVMRTAIAQKEGTNFFGNKREDRFHYEIKVRNNKSVPFTMEIIDQYPLSGNDEISVKRIDHTEGKIDEKTGIVTWKFTLAPGEEKVINLKYEVTYQKNKVINLR